MGAKATATKQSFYIFQRDYMLLGLAYFWLRLGTDKVFVIRFRLGILVFSSSRKKIGSVNGVDFQNIHDSTFF